MKPRVKTLCLYIKWTDSHGLLCSSLLGFVLGVLLTFQSYPDATSFQIFSRRAAVRTLMHCESQKSYSAHWIYSKSHAVGVLGAERMHLLAVRPADSRVAILRVFLFISYRHIQRVRDECQGVVWTRQREMCVGHKLGTETLGTASHFTHSSIGFGPPDLSVWTETDVVWKML